MDKMKILLSNCLLKNLGVMFELIKDSSIFLKMSLLKFIISDYRRTISLSYEKPIFPYLEQNRKLYISKQLSTNSMAPSRIKCFRNFCSAELHSATTLLLGLLAIPDWIEKRRIEFPLIQDHLKRLNAVTKKVCNLNLLNYSTKSKK